MDRLRDLLVKARLVTEAQVREAEKMGLEHNATLAHVLVRGGVIDTQKLAIFLSKKLGLEYAALAERSLSPNVLEQIPLAVAQRLRVIPIALRKTRAGDEIVVAMSDPTDASARREVEHVVKKRVLALVADEVALQRAINQWYGRAPAAPPSAAPPPTAPPPSAPVTSAPPSFFDPPAASPVGVVPVSNPAAHSPARPPAPNPAAQLGQPALSTLPPRLPPKVEDPPVVSGVPLHGITLDGDDGELELELDYGRSGVAGAPPLGFDVAAEAEPQVGNVLDLTSSPTAHATANQRPASPADFLSESTVDVAHMYDQAKAGKGASPLDAITVAPQPPVDLDSDPGTPNLTHSRSMRKAPGDPAVEAGGFLTPNTEEHVKLMQRPGGDFAEDISLDEDTAWLRQRMRGEASDSEAQAPPKNVPTKKGDAPKDPSKKEPAPPSRKKTDDDTGRPSPTAAKPRRKEKRGGPAVPPRLKEKEGAQAPPINAPKLSNPTDQKTALDVPVLQPDSSQRKSPRRDASPKESPRRDAVANVRDEVPPQDFLADASTPSATAPTPPRAHSAATTREVGTPKGPARSRRSAPPPGPRAPVRQAPVAASGPLSETENPTAAYVLDEPTRMDLEGKIGAGDTFDLPSLPSDEVVAGAFDELTIPIEAMPPAIATDVSLTAPSRAKETLPSDSAAVMASSRPLLKVDDSRTELTVTPLSREKDDDSPSLPGGSQRRAKRRPAGDDGPTRIIDFDAKKLDEHRRKKESEGERRAKELKRLREDAKTKRVETDAPRDPDEVAAELKRMRNSARTKVADVGQRQETPVDDERTPPERLAPEPAAPGHSAQATVVVDARQLDSDAPTRVGDAPPPRRRPSPSPQHRESDPAPSKNADATRVTSSPKRREEKTLASIPTMDDPPTQLDISMAQMTMCIVCSEPRLRVALGRGLRKSVSMLYLEESVTASRRLSARIDVDIIVLIDPDNGANLSDEVDRIKHRLADRPLILVLSPMGTPLKIRRAHLRIERPDDDGMIPDAIAQAIGEMLDV